MEHIKGRIEMGSYSVMVYDGSMGYSATAIYASQVTKAVAKSICRYLNRQIWRQKQLSRCQIDIQYYVDYPDYHEKNLDY